MNARLLMIASLVALTACGDDDPGMDMGPGIDMQMPTDDMDVPMDDLAVPTDMPATPTCEGDEALDPILESGFLVLSSDYASTAIGVIAANRASVSTMR